jgi:peptidoglycan-associated lipoprotein
MTLANGKLANSALGKSALRFLAAGLVVLSLTACANQVPNPGANLTGNGESGPATPGSPRDFTVNVGNTVYFTTDSVDLTPDAQGILRNQAGWLNQYPQYTITVEGHADERGTREYNIALGARRSETVRSFLAAQGVNAARMRTISYGKERPVAVCDDISCWSQNRRSVTLLNQRAGT